MSKSRLHTVTSKSFLNQPIQYRQVIHHRNGHSTVGTPYHDLASVLGSRRKKQEGQSKIQHLYYQSSDRGTRNIHYLASVNETEAERRQSRVGRSFYDGSELNKKNLQKRYESEEKKALKTQPKQVQTSKLKLQLKQINLQQKIPSIHSHPNPPKRSVHPQSTSLEQINKKLQNLVNRKLQLVLKQTSKKKDLSRSVARLARQAVNEELQDLICEIKSLKNNSNSTEVALMNNKIKFIETILAEQSTESELMKKYYFGLNSNKKKGKIGDFTHIKNRMGDAYRNAKGQKKERKSIHTEVIPRSKPLFQDTTNKASFKQPRLEDYQSFRYKHKNVSLNLQPLPRSSYQREFLFQQGTPDKKIINRDHSPFNPSNKSPLASIYEKDYKSLKADNFNYKQLDAYKNKIKTLKVNYMPKNRFDSCSLDRQSYYRDAAMSSSRLRSPQQVHRVSENEVSFNKHMLKSQAQRQFTAQSQFQPSRIKHQQLMQAQYRLKNLFKA